MSAVATPSVVITLSDKKLSNSQQTKIRRILCDHYKDIIEKRGYTLSIEEVNMELKNIERRAKLGTLDDPYEHLAAQLGII